MVETRPIDPDRLLEKLLERQEDIKNLRAKVLEELGAGNATTALTLATLYIGDCLVDLNMTLMIPHAVFQEKKQ